MSEKTPWMVKALNEIGVNELPGTGLDSHVAEYLKAVGVEPSPETPWCSAFVSWCLPDLGTKSAWAKSYLHYGIGLNSPKYGCIVVLERGMGLGHVGFWTGEDSEGHPIILGGNQGNKVCIEKFSKMRVLGYRWPIYEPDTTVA